MAVVVVENAVVSEMFANQHDVIKNVVAILLQDSGGDVVARVLAVHAPAAVNVRRVCHVLLTVISASNGVSAAAVMRHILSQVQELEWDRV